MKTSNKYLFGFKQYNLTKAWKFFPKLLTFREAIYQSKMFDRSGGNTKTVIRQLNYLWSIKLFVIAVKLN